MPEPAVIEVTIPVKEEPELVGVNNPEVEIATLLST